MKQTYFSHKSISLLELILVLTVIIFLAGISLNLYPNISRKSKLTANFQNMQNVFNASVTFDASFQNAIPNKCDTLADGSGGLIRLINFGASGPDDFVIGDVSDLEGEIGLGASALLETALREHGFNDVMQGLAPFGEHITFFVRPEVDIGSAEFAYLDTSVPLNRVRAMIGIETYEFPVDSSGNSYGLLLLLGIGSSSNLVGVNSHLNVAPVYLPDASLVTNGSTVDIEGFYFRYINVYELSHYEEVPLNGIPIRRKLRVQFITTVRPGETNFNVITQPLPLVPMVADHIRLVKEFGE